jgi:hypothetical protein
MKARDCAGMRWCAITGAQTPRPFSGTGGKRLRRAKPGSFGQEDPSRVEKSSTGWMAATFWCRRMRPSLETRPRKGINYWFYDDNARKFRIIFFSNNGPFSEEGTVTRARLPARRSHSLGRRVSSTTWTPLAACA